MAILQKGIVTLHKEATRFFLMLAAMESPESWGDVRSRLP